MVKSKTKVDCRTKEGKKSSQCKRKKSPSKKPIIKVSPSYKKRRK